MDRESGDNSAIRVLILAIHGPYEPWLSILKEGQLKTWMSDTGRVRVINVFGKKIPSKWLSMDQKLYFLRWSKSRTISYASLILEALIKKSLFLNRYKPRVKLTLNADLGEVMEIQVPDSLLLQGVKNTAAFRASLNFEYDYLVTTITSSYINIPALEAVLSRAPRDSFVGGRIEISGNEKYQQGSFRVYSRDVIEFLSTSLHLYKHWQIEDIAMGNLIRRKYNSYIELPNLTIKDPNEVVNLDIPRISDICSFRCKSVSNTGERCDIQIMKFLDVLFKNS